MPFGRQIICFNVPLQAFAQIVDRFGVEAAQLDHLPQMRELIIGPISLEDVIHGVDGDTGWLQGAPHAGEKSVKSTGWNVLEHGDGIDAIKSLRRRSE